MWKKAFPSLGMPAIKAKILRVFYFAEMSLKDLNRK